MQMRSNSNTDMRSSALQSAGRLQLNIVMPGIYVHTIDIPPGVGVLPAMPRISKSLARDDHDADQRSPALTLG
jgi:hypothetical protein